MNLVNHRKNKKITQQEMADILGIKRTTYASYEQDLSSPDIETLKKISQFFRVSIDELVGNDISPFISVADFSDRQRQLFNDIKELDEWQLNKLEGYIEALKTAKEEVQKEISKRG